MHDEECTKHQTCEYVNLSIKRLESHGHMLLLFVWCEFRHQTSHSILELTVLGGVDERVDAAVGEHQNHSEVV